jgi:hypothetical protein
LQILISDITKVDEMIMAAGGYKVLAMRPQVLGRQALYALSSEIISSIGAVTYNSLTGKYCKRLYSRIFSKHLVHMYALYKQLAKQCV